MAAESDPGEAEFQAQMEGLRRHFLGELPVRRDLLVSAWSTCEDGGDDAAWLRLRDVAHKLAGSAPYYGLDAVGTAARELDRLLSGRAPCRRRSVAEAAVARLVGVLDAAIGHA